MNSEQSQSKRSVLQRSAPLVSIIFLFSSFVFTLPIRKLYSDVGEKAWEQSYCDMIIGRFPPFLALAFFIALSICIFSLAMFYLTPKEKKQKSFQITAPVLITLFAFILIFLNIPSPQSVPIACGKSSEKYFNQLQQQH